MIYARLNDSERSAWVAKASVAVVGSTVAAHLPAVDAAAMAATLLGEARALELAREHEEAA